MPRGESYFGKPRESAKVPAEVMDRIRAARDAEWTRAIVGEEHPTMTPQQAAQWLETERRRQVSQVVDATRFKGQPKHY
jgi:hypothetical protein